MSIDNAGLRRRSPNPNSPLPQPNIPYSPVLLSPHNNITGNDVIDNRRGLGLGVIYNNPFERYHNPSPFPGLSAPLDTLTPSYANPTIRLVPSSGQPSASIYATRHAPPAARSKSNDETRGSEADEAAASLAALRRNRTDPKSYPVSGRTSRESFVESQLFPRDNRDRLVPPLPLDIKRGKWSRTPSVVSSGSSISGRSGEGTIGSSLPTTPREKRPDSVLSSLASLRNPFARRPESANTASPVQSVRSSRSARSFRSFLSFRSSRSSSSHSSSSTLPVPFYPTAFFKLYGVEGKGDLLKNGSGVVGEKLTDKFPAPAPVRRVSQKKEGWTGYKWLLLLSVITVFIYGLAGLTWALLILYRVTPGSEVTMVSDLDIVIFLTLASLLCIFSSLVGLTGVLLNSRPILAFYTLLLWPTLLSMCLVGYTSYKRGALQLDRKLNQAWSQFLDDGERLEIQNTLKCCGYYNPLHDATYSKKCYPRTTLPGCKSKWTRFERLALHLFSTAAFSTIPLHLANIVVALLTSNHVNTSFGKGMTPPAYRLRMADVRANALAVLKTLPQHPPVRPRSRPRRSSGSLKRYSALSHKHSNISPYRLNSAAASHLSVSSWTSLSSEETLTEMGRTGREGGRRGLGLQDALRTAGPRGRALREARDRGLI